MISKTFIYLYTYEILNFGITKIAVLVMFRWLIEPQRLRLVSHYRDVRINLIRVYLEYDDY